MKKIFGLVLITAILGMSGCSTVLNSSSQMVTVNSNVDGAYVFVNGKKVGQTPFSAKIKRANDTVIEVKKRGYISKKITPATVIPGAFWGNIIIGGFFGSSTDFSTGANNEYSPNTFQINLKKAKKNKK